jgi:hypothetical protein
MPTRKRTNTHNTVEGTEGLWHLFRISPEDKDNQEAAAKLFGLEHFLCPKADTPLQAVLLTTVRINGMDHNPC